MEVHHSDARFQAMPGFGKPGPELLQSLFDQNKDFLELLVSAARSGHTGFPLLTLRNALRRLDKPSRLHLAHAPLLIDAGLSDPERWPSTLRQHPRAHARAAQGHWLSRAAAIKLARSTYHLTWYFVHTFPHTPKLLLGTCDACIAFFQAISLSEIDGLADQRYGWIQPRWQSQPHIWRALLSLSHRTSTSHPGPITVYVMALIHADADRQAQSPEVI